MVFAIVLLKSYVFPWSWARTTEGLKAVDVGIFIIGVAPKLVWMILFRKICPVPKKRIPSASTLTVLLQFVPIFGWHCRQHHRINTK